MKGINFFKVLVISLLLMSCKEIGKSKTTSLDASISKIEVLDFHSTHRCMTCNAIETNTKYTLNTYFTKELKNERIIFRVINVDEKENEKIAKKFEATGTALILNVINKGIETQINLTDFAFMEGNEQDTFSKVLKAKIDAALKTL